VKKKTLQRIEAINQLLEQYGTMTVRQIYYRLLGDVGLSYRQVTYACKVGRKKGFIDPFAIVDRSRPVYGKEVWGGIDEFLEGIPDLFNLDYWRDSPIKPQVWTEKDALSQVMYEIASKYQVDIYVTRGFLSISNKNRWGGGTILYFGDYDPSGLYIDKDIRFDMVFENFKRIALTSEQVREYDLPSFKVKRGDPRTPRYRAVYGDFGWELDALPSDILKNLVGEAIEEYVDFNLEQKQIEEKIIRNTLRINFNIQI
jgi:hypothetical protein